MTPEGYEALVAQLQHEKSVVRPQIVRDIEEARAHGDISENSEYEDAKERQSLCEGRIMRLESLVATAELIDVSRLKRDGKVVFGTWVVVENPVTNEQRTWRIVGEAESNVEKGLISFKSPIAKGLIGRLEGDEVTIPTPGGQQTWEIIEVRYEEA